MIVYKWVLKYGNKYCPIVNNGACPPFDKIDLKFYQKGKTYKDYIDPNLLLPEEKRHRHRNFHRPGYHFWKNLKNLPLERYNKCMIRRGKKINCTLKCYVREKDIIMQDSSRLIANRFRILEEEK